MRKAHVLRLLQPRVSDQTVSELRSLLKSAERGETVGLAYVAVAARNYTVNAVGQARERPTLTRGMIRVLDDLLREHQALRS